MVLAIILVLLSAVSKAIADSIQHHPDTSVFFNTWWEKEGRIIPFTKYKVDGWHIANSTMIASFIGLIFTNLQYLLISYFGLGLLFIITFNVFYNKFFRLKKFR